MFSGRSSRTRAPRTTTRSASGSRRPACATRRSMASSSSCPDSASSRRRATRAECRWSSSRPAGVRSAGTWPFASASSTSQAARASYGCARSSPSSSGSRTSASPGGHAPCSYRHAMLRLLALILPLSLDTFAVSAAIGMLGLPRRTRLRLSLIMASFEAVMPLIGLAIGAALGTALGTGAEYVASAALVAIGAYLILDDDDETDSVAKLATVRGSALLALGVAVSLDELAIGFSAGLLDLPIAWTIALIAVQAFVAAQIGLAVGARLSERAREATERIAGAGLIVLGLVFFVQAIA